MNLRFLADIFGVLACVCIVAVSVYRLLENRERMKEVKDIERQLAEAQAERKAELEAKTREAGKKL